MASSQNLKNTHQIRTYFQERLTSGYQEKQLVPYLNHHKIKYNEISMYEDKVWSLWKETLLKSDSLPEPADASSDHKQFPVHTWQLIGEDPMPFSCFKKGEASAEGRVLFLNLHGSGAKQMEFSATIGWALRYNDAPSVYFIPQIPNEKRYRWWYKPEQYAWERLFRLVMVYEDINPDKIYVIGISEGGYGSQRLAAFYADYLAGAGPMAGGEPLKNAPVLNFRNIAFSLQTGEKDAGFGRNKLTQVAKEEFEKLAAENEGQFVHQIILQPKRGHGIDYTTTTPWLINYSRKSKPHHVSWILFPMDGRYRKGFYNVAFNEPLVIEEGDSYDKAVFDLKHEGNTIHITGELIDSEMKNRKPLEKLNISLFLDQSYIDPDKKVKILLNGKMVVNKKLQADVANLIESVGLFGDSKRIFPYKVNVKL